MFGEERAAVVVSQGITPDEKRRFIAERVRVIQAKVLRGATPYAGGQQPTSGPSAKRRGTSMFRPLRCLGRLQPIVALVRFEALLGTFI